MTAAPRSATEYDVSVVVAYDGAREQLEQRLVAIARACRSHRAEIVFVAPDSVRAEIRGEYPLPLTCVVAASELVPALWGRGIAIARGEFVALTTTQFAPRETWLDALLRRFDDARIAGVGGTIGLAARAGMLGRAVYFIRYSEHLPSKSAPAPHDIAGENAAYRRDAVLSAYPKVADGFWEVDAHRVMRAAGGKIVQARDAVLDFAPVLSLRAMMSNRYVHGGHFGSYRVNTLKWPRWKAVAVTPLVPVVLLMRILQRVARAGHSVAEVFSALPVIIPLLCAWALGEASGALSKRGGRDG
ncbi:MAG TPA: hypothetical protein VJR92_04150 [Gemmatimonadaceae bacterium]|nr:hypothetical protein [Gemmatimonadaceae bacterium]